VTLVDDLRGTFLTGALTDAQLAEMVEAGTEVRYAPDVVLFRQGEPADLLWILLDGHIELTHHTGAEDIVLATMSTPGQWAGGLRAWGGEHNTGAYRATGRSVTEGRCFTLPSEDLRRLVDEWFPFGKHIITGIYQTIRTIEATVRERQSLLALGNIAARLAHEINNPASASLRAVDALRETCDGMLFSLEQLAELGISASQYMALDQLRRDLSVRVAAEEGPVAAMDREEAVGAWLERRAVPRAWQLAPLFAGAGADQAWFEAVEQAVGDAALGPALQWEAATVNARALLGELSDSTNRIANLISAVKSYSQMDRASLQRTDVHEGIDSTVAMFATRLGDITVTRSYEPDLTPIEAFAAELNQVWTNLIDNAIDAMGGAGSLQIATHQDGDHVVVEITDSGSGIAPDVRKRLFEPFFTTKDVGKGTGLGLDISRRIVVDRHHGTIEFDSEPGRTTARVRLPVR